MAVDVEAVVTWLRDHVLDHVAFLSDQRRDAAKSALDEVAGTKPEEPAAETPPAAPAEPPPSEPPADQPTPPEAV